MQETLFVLLTDPSHRDTAEVEALCSDNVSAGIPWYDR